jgi:hypothetical protein
VNSSNTQKSGITYDEDLSIELRNLFHDKNPATHGIDSIRNFINRKRKSLRLSTFEAENKNREMYVLLYLLFDKSLSLSSVKVLAFNILRVSKLFKIENMIFLNFI